jgi:glucose-6-phosphate 1-epimerase
MPRDLPLTDVYRRDLNACLSSCPQVSLISSQDYYPEHTQLDSLDLLLVDTPLCHAVICVQGAQVLEFALKQENPDEPVPLLWLSPLAVFEKGKALRGGIPVCLPWFGVNQQDPNKPKHGFARNRLWRLSRCEAMPDGSIELDFSFVYQPDSPADRELFAHGFSAQLSLSLGAELGLGLSVSNASEQAMPLSWALHSYHPVDDLDKVYLSGLKGREYLDNTADLSVKKQLDEIRFCGEVDRVYQNSEGELLVHSHPAIRVNAQQAPTAIVWNPGKSLAAKMADVGRYYADYICVERGAAFADSLTLKPNETVSAQVIISTK